MKFTLVNPYTVGPAKTTVNAATPIQAAKTLYTNISQYFTNNLPSWFFTIRDHKGKFYHYEINEKKSGEKANFTIREVSMKKEGEEKIREVIAQKGGKKKHKHESSSSSSSSSSSDDKIFRKRYYPSFFEDFMYLSMYYTVEGVVADRLYFPTIVPYVEAYPLFYGLAFTI